MGKFNDITGQKFGRLLVLERVRVNGEMAWKCNCDCGNITYQRYAVLHNGRVKSCGCYSRDTARKLMTRHGCYKSRLYHTWQNMINRCQNKSNKEWRKYLGRGITVCDEWKSDFTKFRDWALSNGYADNLSIDRIDNDKGYFPENCRWADRKTQDANKSNNVNITINGVVKTVSEWSALTGLSSVVITHRYRSGWDENDLLAPAHTIPNYKKCKEEHA